MNLDRHAFKLELDWLVEAYKCEAVKLVVSCSRGEFSIYELKVLGQRVSYAVQIVKPFVRADAPNADQLFTHDSGVTG